MKFLGITDPESLLNVNAEESIKDVVETIDNPNDIGKNEFLAVDFRNKRKSLQKKFDDEIKDDDLKSELASGEFIK